MKNKYWMITWNVHLRRANNYIDQNVIIKKLNNNNNKQGLK